MSWFMVGAAVITGLGAIQSGRAQNAAAQSEANMDEYNAKMADIRTNQAYNSAGNQEDMQRRQARQQIGRQLAASAEAGGGLNTDSLRQSLYGAEEDAMAIRYDGALKAQGLIDEAQIQRTNAQTARQRGQNAKTASYFNAASSALSAGGKYYGRK